MFFGPKIRRRYAFLPLAAILPIRVLCAQQPQAAVEPVVPAIIVKASSTQTNANQFLATFIATAVRLQGAKFIPYVATSAKTRPDLAAKIVVCALNVARLNSHSSNGQLPLATIDQIVRAVVSAAPENAAEIVAPAISSEPYAREAIVVAALAAAPDQATEIYAAAVQPASMSMLLTNTAVSFNPVKDGALGNVNSPEQPPLAW